MPESATALVVGAGPVGLTMAGGLIRHGVPCRIIDANEGPTPLNESRALGLQARTMEVFKGLGISRQVLDQARVIHGLGAFSEGRRVIHLTFDLSDLDTEFPHIYTLPQGRTERALLAHLEALGGRVERSTKLVALTQDDSGVSATLGDASPSTPTASSLTADLPSIARVRPRISSRSVILHIGDETRVKSPGWCRGGGRVERPTSNSLGLAGPQFAT